MALLFIDLLGTKSKWLRDGLPGVQAAFAAFRACVRTGLQAVAVNQILGGGIESDSAAIVCPDAGTAVAIGQAAFQHAFAANPRGDRMWLRGVVTASDPALANVRPDAPLAAPYNSVSNFEYSEPLLTAISVERSGFKGMRLLVANELITNALRRQFGVPMAVRTLLPFRKLTHSVYPVRIADQYQDFLWMTACEDAQWDRNRRAMENRLRYAAADAEEVIQAAATQIAFHEVGAIRASLT